MERFFATISHLIAKEDPASEHYYWKIASQKQSRFHLTRERLVTVIGVDATDRLLRRIARRARSPRRALLLAVVFLWLAPGPLAAHRGTFVVFVTPIGVLLGSSVLRRGIKKAARLLGGAGEHPLVDFPYGDVRSVVLRHRKTVPAAALRPHPQQRVLAGHLGLTDPEILEIAEKLADEFAGSAVELIETARRLH